MQKQGLTFEELVKKYVPSVKIDKSNPSTLASVSHYKCLELLNSPEPVYGLNDEQRGELCSLIKSFENIIYATNSNKTNPTSDNDDIYKNQSLTLYGLYEQTKRSAVQADNEELTYTQN